MKESLASRRTSAMVLFRGLSAAKTKPNATVSTNFVPNQQRVTLNVARGDHHCCDTAAIAAAGVNFESRGELILDRSRTISQKKYRTRAGENSSPTGVVEAAAHVDETQEGGRQVEGRPGVHKHVGSA
jgi:hypothetical protein